MRLFVAVEIPAEVKREIGTRVDALRRSVADASWTKSDTLHVTLAFLGEQDESAVAPVVDAMQRQLSTLAPFRARLAGCGFFPNERRARVAWVGVAPPEPLTAMAIAVRAACREAKVEFDDKPFKPHLTIARIRGRWSERDVAHVRESFSGDIGAPFVVPEGVLFRSELSSRGATHTALARVGLG